MTIATDRRVGLATLDIRPATEPERRACRMLVPASSTWVWPAEYLVAMKSSPPQLVGTLASTPTLLAGEPAWLVMVRVIRTHRRQGIGLCLLDLAIDRARSGGIPSLVSHVNSNSSPEAAAFLQAAGFHPARTLTTFEGDLDLDRYEADIRPIYDRLEARGKIPADVSIVSLREAPLDQVCRLYAKNLGGTINRVELFLRHALGAGRLASAFTLMLGGRVVALHLLDIHQSIVELHAKIVAPEYRAGWANTLLSREFARRLRESGTHRVRYSAANHVAHSLKFAQRQSIAVVNVATQFIRDL